MRAGGVRHNQAPLNRPAPPRPASSTRSIRQAWLTQPWLLAAFCAIRHPQACDDGSDRTALTCEVLAELGYTNVMTLEGGVNAYLEHDPLTAQDKKPVWKLTGQTSGVRYAYNDGDGDDSA